MIGIIFIIFNINFHIRSLIENKRISMKITMEKSVQRNCALGSWKEENP